MRIKDSKRELFLAEDILGGLMPWEEGYELAWWSKEKEFKLTKMSLI